MGEEIPLSRHAAFGFGISYEKFSYSLKSLLIDGLKGMSDGEKESKTKRFQEFRNAMNLSYDKMNTFIDEMKISEKCRTKLRNKVQRLGRLYNEISLEDYMYGNYLDHLSTCDECCEDIMSDSGYSNMSRDEKRIYQGHFSRFFTGKDEHPLKYIYRLDSEIRAEFSEYAKKIERKTKSVTKSSDVFPHPKVLDFSQRGVGHIHTRDSTTSIDAVQKTPLDRLSQIQARVENLMRGTRRLDNNELNDLYRKTQLLGESNPELLSVVRTVLERVAELSKGYVISDTCSSNTVSEGIVTPGNREKTIDTVILNHAEIESALGIIQNFRRHVGVPSSTNHTKLGSKGDGSFWYRAIGPMMDFLGQQIETGKIQPDNFSWAQLVDIHITDVEIQNQVDDLSTFRIFLSQFKQNQNLIDNIHLLSTVLENLRGNGRFRKGQSFLKLIKLIDTF